MNYQEPDDQQYFPGKNSDRQLLISGLDEQVSQIVGGDVVAMPNSGHARTRIALEGEEGRGKVHIDDSHLSGILYLTLPENCKGGTDFFRHKETMTDRAPINEDEMHAMGLNNIRELWDKIILPQSTDESKWERTMRVPMRYNRLILLKPWLWHTAGPGFGDCLANGRLVYLMFFNYKNEPNLNPNKVYG